MYRMIIKGRKILGNTQNIVGRTDDTGTGCADRVAESHSAAVHIHLSQVQVQQPIVIVAVVLYIICTSV